MTVATNINKEIIDKCLFLVQYHKLQNPVSLIRWCIKITTKINLGETYQTNER